jgi:hypothetical protein
MQKECWQPNPATMPLKRPSLKVADTKITDPSPVGRATHKEYRKGNQYGTRDRPSHHSYIAYLRETLWQKYKIDSALLRSIHLLLQ